jgi:hypothetical protein
VKVVCYIVTSSKNTYFAIISKIEEKKVVSVVLDILMHFSTTNQFFHMKPWGVSNHIGDLS